MKRLPRPAVVMLVLIAFCAALAAPGASAPPGPPEADQLAEQAEQLSARGEYGAAIPLAQQVLTMRRQALGPEHPAVLKSLSILAGLYYLAGGYRESEALFLQVLALEEKVLGLEHPNYAADLNNLGSLYHLLGQYPEAERRLRQALAIAVRGAGEDHPTTATFAQNLGALYLELGRYAEARPLLQRALTVKTRQLGEDHPDTALALVQMAKLHKATGEYGEAERLFIQALAIRTRARGPRHPETLHSMSDLAELQRELGRYRQAAALQLQALAISRQVLGPEHPDVGSILNSLAATARGTGDYERAEALYQQGLAVARKAFGTDHLAYAAGLNNLGDLYGNLGRYPAAEPLLRESLAIKRRLLGDAHPSTLTGVNNLATLYRMMGRFSEAESLLLGVVESMRPAVGPDHPVSLTAVANLGDLYWAAGDYSKAEPLVREAVAGSRRVLGEDHPDTLKRLNSLAAVYQATRRYPQAEALYRQVGDRQKRRLGASHPDYVNTRFNLASCYAMQGKMKEALAVQQQALAAEQQGLERIFAFATEPAMRAYLLRAEASLYMLLAMARTSAREGKSAAAADGSSALAWVLRRKGIVFDALHRFREAARLAEGEPEVAKDAARLRRLRQRLADVALAPPAPGEAPGRDAELATLRQESEELTAALNRRAAPRLRPPVRAGVNAVRRRLPRGAALVEILYTPTYDFQAANPAVPWKAARYLAFVLMADQRQSPRMVDLGPAETIDRAVATVRECVGQPGRGVTLAGLPRRPPATDVAGEARFKKASARLYRLVFAPLCPALGGASLVCLAPDSELNRVPFEALVDGRGKYLVEASRDGYRFAYLTSGRDLLRTPEPPRWGALVFAGPDFDGPVGLPPAGAPEPGTLPGDPYSFAGEVPAAARPRPAWTSLPGAAAEAQMVRTTLQGTAYAPVVTYLGPDALEGTLKAAHAPRLLHIATHGYFLEEDAQAPDSAAGTGLREPDEPLRYLRGVQDPLLRCGVVLAGANQRRPAEKGKPGEDGWVTAEELAALDLRGTELVVLSACDTGLGDVRTAEGESGQGVQGLRWSVFAAGARSVLTSLFSVPDEETRQLMVYFYAGLKRGEGRLAALHGAELAMIQERRRSTGSSHPFYWASFVLAGDPR